MVEGEFVAHIPRLAEPLHDAIGLFINATAAHVVAPAADEVEGVAYPLAVIEEIFLVTSHAGVAVEAVAQVMRREPDGPGVLVGDLDRIVQFLLGNLLRGELLQDLEVNPGCGAERGFGVDVREFALARLAGEAGVGREIQRGEIA